MSAMKSLTVRLPDDLVAELEAASREGNTTVSSVVRDRVAHYKTAPTQKGDTLSLIGDLVGSLNGVPPDMSGNIKHYLKKSGYGRRAH